MDATQFAYWLQGYSEITQGQVPTPAQWQIIQDHLKLVFTKITPDRSTVGQEGVFIPSTGLGQNYC